MTVAATLHRLRADQAGSTLPEAMVAVAITGLTLGMIATAIIGMTTFQNQVGQSSESQNARLTTELEWRSDIIRAQHVTVTDSTDVTFATTNREGLCREQRWQIIGDQIIVTRNSYDTPVTESGCAGDITSTSSRTSLTGISDTSFRYRNIGGQTITYNAGQATFNGGTKPASIPESRWNSTSIGAATIDGQVNRLASGPVDFRVTQVVSQIADQVLTSAVTP